MAQLTRAFGGRAFEHGSAYGTGDGSGAALWLPPGVGPDEEAIDELIAGTVAPPKIDIVGRIFESMASFHPQEPHWYLPVIGVDPAYQGKGHGAALMRMALHRCDRDHLPAYLESSNPRNITLYRRHGFEPLGEIQLDDAPPVVPMLRPAR